MATANIGTVEGLILLRDEFTGVLNKAGDQLAQAGKKMDKVGRRMTQVGGDMTRAITLPLVAVGGAAVKFSTDFESSFAGVRKTVDATEEEFAELAAGMRQLAREDIPIDVNELNAIGEAAGQLGIEKENILGFTRTIADLAVTTNLTTDQAASDFARLANITGLPQTQFENLGSTVVALGNTMATTESEIVDFALRIAGAGEIAGLTEPEILGIGAAMTSVGVQSEAGGTAVQKVLLSMVEAAENGGDELAVFAKTAGLSAQEFADVFEKDAATAFRLFVEGLGEQGTKAFGTLEELNLQDQRLIRSFISLAGAGDLLGRAMAEGSAAFEENTALAKEAEQRYSTFASQLRLAWNQIKDVAITLGTALMPVLRDGLAALKPWIARLAEMAEKFAKLSGPTKTLIVAFAAVAAAIGPLLIVAGQAAIAFGALSTAAPLLTAKLTAMLGPWGLISVAITAVVVATNKWIDQQNEAHKQTLDNIASTNDYGIAVNDLRVALSEAADGQRELTAAEIEAVGFGLAPLQIEIAAATEKLERLSGEAKHNHQVMRQGLPVYDAAGQPVVRLSDAYLEARDHLAALNVRQKSAQKVLTDSAARYVSLTKAVDKSSGALKKNTESLTKTGKAMGDLESKKLKAFQARLRGMVRELDLSGLSLNELQEIALHTHAPIALLDEASADLTDTTGGLGDAADDTANSFDAFAARFAEATVDIILGAKSIKDAFKGLFEIEFKKNLTEFVSDFTSAFNEAKESGDSTARALTKSWDEAKLALAGNFAAISAAAAAMGGEIEGLVAGTVSAIANFQTGNFFGAAIAGAGVLVGLMSLLGGHTRDASDVAKEFGLTLSEDLLAAIDGVNKRIKDLDTAFLLFLGDTIREVGISSINDLDKFLGLTRDLLEQLAGATVDAAEAFDGAAESMDDMTDSSLKQSDVVLALGDAIFEIVSRFQAAGGGMRNFNELVALYVSLLDEVVAGNFDANEATEILGRTLGEVVEIAIGLGEEAIEGILAIVEAARAAGLETGALAGALEAAYAEAFDVLEQRNAFLLEQSTALLAGLEQMFAGVAQASEREVEFAATAVLQAFAAMQEAGAPLTEILAQLGDAFALIAARGEELGVELPEAFGRLGEVLDILARQGIAGAINALEGMAAATGALGNMGLLTADQFDTFGDSVRQAFNRLINQGLTSAEALAVLAPQLQLLNDLSEQYGFELDKNTQRLLDQATAQGLVKDKGLDTNDVMILGFDRLLTALNALIVAMGGVPVEFEAWATSAANASGSIESSLDRVDDAVANTTKGAKALSDVIDKIGSDAPPGKKDLSTVSPLDASRTVELGAFVQSPEFSQSDSSSAGIRDQTVALLDGLDAIEDRIAQEGTREDQQLGDLIASMLTPAAVTP